MLLKPINLISDQKLILNNLLTINLEKFAKISKKKKRTISIPMNQLLS